MAIEVAVWFGEKRTRSADDGGANGAGLEGMMGPGRNDLDAALDSEWEDEELLEPALPTRDPDRVRVMVVPDAPEPAGGGAS